MPAKYAKIREKNLGNNSVRWSYLIPSAYQKKNTAEVYSGELILLCAAPRPWR